MGLDFTHGDAHWSYGGFMRFRARLIETLELGNLNDMYDDGSYYEKLENIPIFPLINHSDCDGELTVEEMKAIIPQLDLIVSMWESQQPSDYDAERGRQFVDGMKYAIEENEPMEFI